MSDPRSIPNPRTFRERFGALRTLRPFLAMVWEISPGLMASALLSNGQRYAEFYPAAMQE